MKTKVLGKTLAFASLLAWMSSSYAIQPVDPLQKYDYRDLYLIRTFPRNMGAAACFITKDDKVAWAYRGNYVGKRFGWITEIDTSGVVLSEEVEVNFGEWVPNRFYYPLASEPPKEAQFRCSQPPHKVLGEEQRARALKNLRRVRTGSSLDDMLRLLGKPTIRETLFDKHGRATYTVYEYYFSRAAPSDGTKRDKFVYFYLDENSVVVKVESSVQINGVTTNKNNSN